MSEVGVLVVDDDFMVARIHRGFVDRVEGFEVVQEEFDPPSSWSDVLAHEGLAALA